MKFVVSALTYPGEDAIEYAEKLLSEGVGDIAGFGRMTFAYPTFYKDYSESTSQWVVTLGSTHLNKLTD